MPTRKPAPTPRPSAPRTPRAVPSHDPRDSGAMDAVRDIIQEVRDLRDGLDRLRIEIEKLWARERLHSRAVAAATKPRSTGRPTGGKPATRTATKPTAKGGKAVTRGAGKGKTASNARRPGGPVKRTSTKPAKRASAARSTAKRATKRSRSPRPGR